MNLAALMAYAHLAPAARVLEELIIAGHASVSLSPNAQRTSNNRIVCTITFSAGKDVLGFASSVPAALGSAITRAVELHLLDG